MGGGVYIGEIESLLAGERKTLSQKIKKDLMRVFLALIGVGIGSVVLVQIITGRLKRYFNRFLSFFQEASANYIRIDREAIRITEFADLAKSANSMIDARNTTEQELQESKKWAESIFNSIQSGIMVIDAETRTIVDINPAGARLIGYDKDTVLNGDCKEYFCKSEKDHCPILDFGKEMLNEERTVFKRRRKSNTGYQNGK